MLETPRPFPLAPDGTDVFWNLVYPSPTSRTRYVRAIEIRLGDRKVGHHANPLVDRARVARRRDGSTGVVGFPGMDVSLESEGFDPDSHFLFWKPGTAPYEEEALMRRRLAKYPRDFSAHYNLGAALQLRGRAEEAVRELEEAVRLAPGRAAAHTALGGALLAQGRREQAIRAFREALRVDPRYASEARTGVGKDSQMTFPCTSARMRACWIRPRSRCCASTTTTRSPSRAPSGWAFSVRRAGRS